MIKLVLEKNYYIVLLFFREGVVPGIRWLCWIEVPPDLYFDFNPRFGE
jgi:hypothetical protein